MKHAKGIDIMEFNRQKIPSYLMILTIVAVVVIFNVTYFIDYISANNEKIVDYALSDEDVNPVRETAVAGLFYPADMYQLDKDLDGYLENVPSTLSNRPQMLIVPHAGYKYSATVAAHAYKRLLPFQDKIKNVFLLGPSHRVFVKGVALSPAKYFKTPLGKVSVNEAVVKELAARKGLFQMNAAAHKNEHSLEVQLPFLQKTLKNFAIIPMLYGDVSPKDIAAALKPYLENDSSILIISADLSHYLDYETAVQTDAQTAEQIQQSTALQPHRSCGATAINTAMILARDMGLVPHLLDMVNSGDTSDDKTRVVGYGAWAYDEPEDEEIPEGIALEQKHLENFARHHKNELLEIVKKSLDAAVTSKELYHPQRENAQDILFNKGASFVTLTKDGKLRGCIGSVLPEKSIAADLAYNAFAAALQDKRFAPVEPDELNKIDFTISLLTNFEEITFTSYEDLLSKLRPTVDGVLIRDGKRQGLFLPAVWKDIPDKQDFMTELKLKAGLSPSYWSDNIKVFRFRTVEIQNDKN